MNSSSLWGLVIQLQCFIVSVILLMLCCVGLFATWHRIRTQEDTKMKALSPNKITDLDRFRHAFGCFEYSKTPWGSFRFGHPHTLSDIKWCLKLWSGPNWWSLNIPQTGHDQGVLDQPIKGIINLYILDFTAWIIDTLTTHFVQSALVDTLARTNSNPSYSNHCHFL